MRKRDLRIRPALGRSACFRPLALEQLEPRTLLAGLPLGAMPQDTGEYMLGDVAVSLVLMESTGAESSEDWTSDSIDAVKTKIRQALDWWEDTLAARNTVHTLQFQIDEQYADNPVPTGIEPIAHISNDYTIWVNDFLDHVNGNSLEDISTDMRLFNHQQRTASDGDWGFTIFVVNDENDSDGLFASGGSFRKAFAFAGGRYFIMPASRPVVSVTHEAGHMFWARDEYNGGGSYQDHRGYYNTQNLNAANNPAAGFNQVESIMASSSLMTSAFDNHTSSPSSLEMIGWKDSDQNGVFDVLDLPLLLEGSGFPDPATGSYHFQGTSRVQALPNINPSGFQSDITINTIDVVEYRVDSGSWQTVATPGDPVVSIDVSFAVPSGDHAVEVRTRAVDAGSGQTVATSNSLVGTTLIRSVTQQAGIAGYVFADADANGAWDGGEGGVEGWNVQIVDSGGQPMDLWAIAEPDDHNDAAIINGAFPGMTLSAVGGGTAGDSVYSRASMQASTWGRVFANHNSSIGAIRPTWNDTGRQLRIDFDDAVTAVRIDAIGNGGVDYGRLEIYDDQSTLLARYTTAPLSAGDFETMELARPQGDIAYAVASSHYGSEVHLDRLRAGALAQTSTDAAGAFRLDELEAGTYHVKVVIPNAWQASEPASATRQVTLTGGQLPGQLSFGAAPPPWHNVSRRHDVNGDGSTVPLDALMVINDLNMLGSRELPEPAGGLSPPPYLDVNADGFVSNIDALQVINQLNDQLNGETGAELFPLSLNALAVVAEGEPSPAESPLAESDNESVDQAWADLRFTADLRPSGGATADVDGLGERVNLSNDLLLEEPLDEIIGDDLLGQTWLEWSSDGELPGARVKVRLGESG
jgi:hypothetical protein